MPSTRLLAPTAMLLLLNGCAVGPAYRPPVSETAAAWTSDLPAGAAADAADLAAWWTHLDDPLLDDLVARAAAGNLDAATARSRVREARAQRQASGSGDLPSLDAGAATRRTAGEDPDRTTWSASLDASWELDLFGGRKRSVEAADADVEAAEATLQDVLVSLVAEVALDYVEARSLQTQLRVAQENLAAQEESLRIVQWRREAGLDDDLAVAQARSSVAATRAQIPSLEQSLEQTWNALAVLLGEQPGALHATLADPAPVPSLSTTLAVGAPADLLRRRPDVRAAERTLAAQTARTGAAKAELYPGLSLSGTLGWAAGVLSDLFQGDPAGSVGAALSLPLFRNGALNAAVAVRTEQQEQALIAYEAAVLAALQEAEDALVAAAREEERLTQLREARAAAALAAELAAAQYAAGLVDFTSTLDAQRTLLSLDGQLVQSEAAVTTDVIRLYKALGGGWPTGADATAPLRTGASS